MPQLLKPQSAKVLTKDGECLISIALELTINLKSDEGIKSNVATPTLVETGIAEENKGWTIQDFAPKKKVKFGKQIEE